MSKRAELKAAIAVLERRPYSRESVAYLLNEYRSQLAALPPEPAQPWTPREREARKVIETLLASAHPNAKEHPTMTSAWKVGQEFLNSDTPPPDPRDEALEMAEKALEKVESYLNRVNHVHLLDGSILYVSEVFAALAAIARARGGK